MSGEWKSTVWQEKLKNKPVRYWIRDEIEEIIKEESIDRKRFYEASKFQYADIIDKFCCSFFDRKRNPDRTDLSYLWLNFKKQLNHSEPVMFTESWSAYINNIVSLIPDYNENELYYLVLSQGWVYEGYACDIITVLNETDGLLEDFYIVSKKYEWCICHCDDGRNMQLITK